MSVKLLVEIPTNNYSMPGLTDFSYRKWHESMTMFQNSPVSFRIDTLKTHSSRTTMGIFLSEIFISASPRVIRHDQSIVTFLSENYYGISLALHRFHYEFLIKWNFWLPGKSEISDLLCKQCICIYKCSKQTSGVAAGSLFLCLLG